MDTNSVNIYENVLNAKLVESFVIILTHSSHFLARLQLRKWQL